MKPALLSNLALIREARITKDPEQQLILASHPSKLVRRALIQNPYLCEEAIALVGDDLLSIRSRMGARIRTAKN